MIDTHCHLTYDQLSSQIDLVIGRAQAAGVDRMITIGTTPQDAAKAVALSRKYPGVYTAAGVHPHYSADHQDKARLQDQLRELLQFENAVAIGEMGLDRHYSDPPIDVQRVAFSAQLELARELDRSVIIHSREAVDEVVGMIRDSGIAPDRFVFHCFTGTDAELDRILELGALVSFTGVVTFAGSTALTQSACRVPIDRIMIETDAPYLTPAPHRKIKVNEPSYLPYTARHLAQARGMTAEAFVLAVDKNADRFFRIKPNQD
jgi:TatD DNase family protein